MDGVETLTNPPLRTTLQSKKDAKDVRMDLYSVVRGGDINSQQKRRRTDGKHFRYGALNVPKLLT